MKVKVFVDRMCKCADVLSVSRYRVTKRDLPPFSFNVQRASGIKKADVLVAIPELFASGAITIGSNKHTGEALTDFLAANKAEVNVSDETSMAAFFSDVADKSFSMNNKGNRRGLLAALTVMQQVIEDCAEGLPHSMITDPAVKQEIIEKLMSVAMNTPESMIGIHQQLTRMSMNTPDAVGTLIYDLAMKAKQLPPKQRLIQLSLLQRHPIVQHELRTNGKGEYVNPICAGQLGRVCRGVRALEVELCGDKPSSARADNTSRLFAAPADAHRQSEVAPAVVDSTVRSRSTAASH